MRRGMGAYVDKRGRIVSDIRVRRAIDDYLEKKSKAVRDLAEQLQQGRIDLPTWQRSMEREISKIHLANMAAAHGGKDRLTKSHFGSVGQLVRQELEGLKEWDPEPDPKKKKKAGGLNAFASAIQNGDIPMDGRFVARAMQYAQAGRHTYEVERKKRAVAAGMTQGRSVRHHSDSCAGCVRQANAGWQLIGDIIPPGERNCKRYCKCTIEYRYVDPNDDVDDIVKRALAGEKISRSELRRLASGIAESGFDERFQQKVKLKDGIVGLTHNGETVQRGERLSPGAVHFLKHVVAQQEWPAGTTEEGYYESIRKVITDRNSGIILYKKNGETYVDFTNNSGDLKGQGGKQRIVVGYSLSNQSWTTSHQLDNFKDIRHKRSQIKSLRKTPKAR